MKLTQNTKCIYIVYAKEVNRVKIGMSNNPITRLNDLQTSSSVLLELVYYSKPIYKPSKLEHTLHSVFESKRFIGEWFNIIPDEAIFMLNNFIDAYKIDKVLTYYEKNNRNATTVANIYSVTKQSVIKYLKYKGWYTKRVSEDNYYTNAVSRKKNIPIIKKDVCPKFVIDKIYTPVTKSVLELMVERNNKKVKARLEKQKRNKYH